jgi:hypothetical protein
MEIIMSYEQLEYGVIGVGSSGKTIIIEEKKFAPGIWAGVEDIPIEIRDPTGEIVKGSAKIVGVNLDNRILTLDSEIPTMNVGDIICYKESYDN